MKLVVLKLIGSSITVSPVEHELSMELALLNLMLGHKVLLTVDLVPAMCGIHHQNTSGDC